jgi:hypothetical protein
MERLFILEATVSERGTVENAFFICLRRRFSLVNRLNPGVRTGRQTSECIDGRTSLFRLAFSKKTNKV